MSRLGRVFSEFMNVEAEICRGLMSSLFWECKGWVSRLGGVFIEFINVEAVSRLERDILKS